MQAVGPRPTPRPNRGRYASEDEALGATVTALVRSLAPQAVYLFGSRAEGRARPDSDFDLLVVLDDAAPDAATTHDAVYAPLLGSGVGCDVVPCRRADFDAVMASPANPWQAVWRRARKLYERGWGRDGRTCRCADGDVLNASRHHGSVGFALPR